MHKQKLDGKRDGRGFFSFESKEKQKTPFVAVKATSANRNRSAVHCFRAGQQSWPCCARAHSEKPPDRPKNKLVCFFGWPAVFLMPGSSLAVFQVTGANYLLLRPSRFARWDSKGMKSLWRGFGRAERPTLPLPNSVDDKYKKEEIAH